jgi:hypothetical protein
VERGVLRRISPFALVQYQLCRPCGVCEPRQGTWRISRIDDRHAIINRPVREAKFGGAKIGTLAVGSPAARTANVRVDYRGGIDGLRDRGGIGLPGFGFG